MSAGFVGWAAPRDGSVLDRLDVRTRLLAAVAIVMTGLGLRDLRLLGLSIVGLVIAALVARVRLAEIGRRLVHVEGFLLVLVAILPFSTAGEPVFRLGPWSASEAGLMRAGLVLARVNVAALAMLILVAGLEPVRFGHALGRLGMPRRLVHLLLFAVRYVELLRAEAARLHDAMRARAFRATTSRRSLRTLGHFVGQMLVRSLERAERVDEAMRCRGFSGRFALVRTEGFGRIDAGVGLGLGGLLLILVLADRLT